MDAFEDLSEKIKKNPDFYLSLLVVLFCLLVLGYFIVAGLAELVRSMIEIKRVVNYKKHKNEFMKRKIEEALR